MITFESVKESGKLIVLILSIILSVYLFLNKTPVRINFSVIDFGTEADEKNLTYGWYAREKTQPFRWMAKKAGIIMERPGSAGRKGSNIYRIVIRYYATVRYLPKKELNVTVKCNNIILGFQKITRSGDGYIDLKFTGSLPERVPIDIELDNCFLGKKDGKDRQELGIAIRRIGLYYHE